jgi:RimJ/RimL family protein N-acetyltransferase
MNLRPATPDDFGFIRGLTGDPSYAPFIGDDDEAKLTAYLADPKVRMMIWQADAPLGFAIFREIGHASGRVELFRLALAQTDTGRGRDFMAALIGFAFQDLKAARLWLDCSGENPRARRLYETAGFLQEGCLRSHWHRPALGRAVDMVLYGMMRDEVPALPPA